MWFFSFIYLFISLQNLQWARDVLLGSSVPWQQLKHMPAQGLFCERNKTNLFNVSQSPPCLRPLSCSAYIIMLTHTHCSLPLLTSAITGFIGNFIIVKISVTFFTWDRRETFLPTVIGLWLKAVCFSNQDLWEYYIYHNIHINIKFLHHF